MSLFKPLFFLCHHFFFILVGLLGVGFIIGFHELGHFLFCKLFSVRTPSFSIGFGPKIFSKKIGETEFSLSAIPVGGYVEPDMGTSEHGMDRHALPTKPYWQKALIIIAGISFNLIFAYFALILLFATGIPNSPMLYPFNATQIVSEVEPGSPAEQAGLKVGDTIKSINDKQLFVKRTGQPGLAANVERSRLFKETFKELKNSTGPISLTITRDGQALDLDYTPAKQLVFGKEITSPGFSLARESVPGFPIIQAIKYGIATTNAYIVMTLNAFKHMFSKRDFKGAGGPLSLISATVSSASQGFKIFILLLALISINLAILNLIPVPILDGGQLLFYTIEAIIGKPLPVKVREYISIASWVLFMILILYLSIKDVHMMTSPYLESIKNFFGRK